MSEVTTTTIIKDTSASAGPLGLSAFGFCTILLSLTNAGVIAFDATVLSMGLFYGGLTQIIVGLLEGKKGNTFGLVAFTSYGIFWVAFVSMNVLPGMNIMPAPSAGGINAFLILWCLFTVILFIATLKLPKILQILFGALILLFVLLIAGSLTGNPAITTAAGYEGVVVGLLSLYASSAFLLNEIYGKTVLPIG
ncbi:MAG TPA: acetate uptake transporter [Cyclobacteriaceae bacterium]|nr:acetate uptake transporter [Cyclobacteriaceae bacterium]